MSLNDPDPNVQIQDGTLNGQLARVDATGRLRTAADHLAIPDGATRQRVAVNGDVNGTVDNVYVIPNGQTLTILRFGGSAEGGGGFNASKIEIWYDPNGTGLGMTLIHSVHAADATHDVPIMLSYAGNGTIAIRLRRERLDSGTTEIFGFWEGYTE